MTIKIDQLGQQLNIDVLSRMVDLKDKTVVDAGCGNLTFTNILADQGAQVIAVDPDPIQATQLKNQSLRTEIRFVETGAEQLPCADQSVDGIFFSYSLHHIHHTLHDAVLDESLRVLKPSGFIYAIEPIDCPLNQVMKLFHNEDVERECAWSSLNRYVSHFQKVTAVEYFGEAHYDSWQHFADHFGHRSYNPDYTYEDVDCEAVRLAFMRHATPTETGFRFASPKRVVCMQQKKQQVAK